MKERGESKDVAVLARGQPAHLIEHGQEVIRTMPVTVPLRPSRCHAAESGRFFQQARWNEFLQAGGKGAWWNSHDWM
jgi:hypothetical protein